LKPQRVKKIIFLATEVTENTEIIGLERQMKSEYYLAVVTLCNALIVAIIAVRQYILSKERFKFDMFDKRYGVIQGVEIVYNSL
jgi:hypothetical protein